MAQQTINVGAAPNDGTGTPLRTAFQYTNSNFSELYTATGPSGNNITVPGTATITGAANFNGGALAGYLNGFLMFGSSGNVLNLFAQSSGFHIKNNSGTYPLLTLNNSGDLTVQDGAGSGRLILNATGLGVGGAPVNPLTVFAAASAKAPALLLSTAGSPTYGWDFSVDGAVNGNLFIRSLVGGTKTDVLEFDRATGNVGIGVTPSAITAGRGLEVGAVGNGLWCNNSSFNQLLQNAYFSSASATGWKYAAAASTQAVRVQLGSGEFNVFNAVAGTAGTDLTWTPILTLDASGRLLVGLTSSPYGTSRSWFSYDGGTVYGAGYKNITAGSGTAVVFVSSTNGLAGYISTTDTTVTYASVSDYRLKQDVKPLSGGLARVNALKPSIYKWKSDGSSAEGFIAHELAEVVPSAVIGSKDEVNEDGSIKAQGVDLSKVVPILVAAIQELAAEVNALKNT